jgi:hypothetical protein
VDILVDNAGTELLSDLALVDALLSDSQGRQVVMHAKVDPTFVSDATVDDVRHTIDLLAEQPPGCSRALGERLREAFELGRFDVRTHRFWNSPLFFWDLPADLSADLAGAGVVIVKGDANYRRLVGDCRWATDASFAHLCEYFPSSIIALRVLKSEVVTGFPSSQVEALDGRAPAWRTNGRFAVAQWREKIL